MTISQIDGVEHKKGNYIPGSYVIMKYNMLYNGKTEQRIRIIKRIM